MTRVQILSTLTHTLNLSDRLTDFLEAIYYSTVQHMHKCLQDRGPDDHFQMSMCCRESSGTSTPGRRKFQGTEFSQRLYHPTISLPGRARAQDNFCLWISGEANATQPQREPGRDKSSGLTCRPWMDFLFGMLLTKLAKRTWFMSLWYEL